MLKKIRPNEKLVKASRPTYVIVALVGLIFCIGGVVGIFLAINDGLERNWPVVPFFVGWMLISGGITYNAASYLSMDSKDIALIIDSDGQSENDFETKLKKLNELKKEGLITDKEFEEKRKKTMKSI